MASKLSKYVVIVAILALISGCAAMVGTELTGVTPAGSVYTVRSQDKMGINTANTFLVGADGKLLYGHTSAQAGINKTMVEQIIPAVSNASIGTFTGVFFPKPGATNINTGTGSITQTQGQITGQQQGQVGIVGGP